MNKTLTSKEAILAVAKEIVTQAGTQALNMREVAQRCNVAVGSVYNYFPSKEDLLIETIQMVWTEIMHHSKECSSEIGFAENVIFLFERVRSGADKYPSFFTIHSMNFSGGEKSKGREAMNQYFDHIKRGLKESLSRDGKVRKDAFDDDFTKADFVDFVFTNLISLFMRKQTSCSFLLEVIKRTIYSEERVKDKSFTSNLKN